MMQTITLAGTFIYTLLQITITIYSQLPIPAKYAKQEKVAKRKKKMHIKSLFRIPSFDTARPSLPLAMLSITVKCEN